MWQNAFYLPPKAKKGEEMMRNFSRLVFLVVAMHKRSPLFCLIFPLVLLVGFTGTAAALECPDFIAEDWDDKPTCAWIRNDTNETITVSPWQIYQDSGDLNDDYWRGGDTVIPPGELRVVVGLDNDGWGVANYDTVRGKSNIQIGSKPAGTFLYMEADIWAGIVGDFEYSLNGSAWVDGFAEETRNIAGTDYKFTVADKWNYARAVFDVFFTISSQTTNQGNMGYLPPDTKDDPFRLNVMNYNTYLLLGPTATSGKLDYCERAQRIADNASRIFANVDILVMEELASQDTCTPDAEDLADEEFLCCGTDKPFRDRTLLLNGNPLVNGPAGPSETGGVVIMSRYPNSLAGNVRAMADYTDTASSFSDEDEVHYIFREDNGECFGKDPIGVGSGVADCLMDKGFLRVKFTKSVTLPGKTISQDYYIIGTHSQAEKNAESKAARTKQYKAIAAYADALPEDVPIIIVGDLNTEQDEINSMYTTLNAASEVPPYYNSRKGPLRFSENYYANYYALLQHESNDGKRDNFDWILYSEHGLKPSQFNWRYLSIRDKTWGRGDLSDHEAVLAEFEFRSSTIKLLHPDDSIIRGGAVFQTIVPIPDNGDPVTKVITAQFPPDAKLANASFRFNIAHPNETDLTVSLKYFEPGQEPVGGDICRGGFNIPCDLDFSALINLDVLPWQPSGRWELEVSDKVANGLVGSLDWFEITLDVTGLPEQSADDADGDGIANLDDRCPLDENNLCADGSSVAAMFQADLGGTFAPLDQLEISIPTGALDGSGELYVFATQTEQGVGFGLVTAAGSGSGIYSVDLTPSLVFSEPVSITLKWFDDDNDGIIDGTIFPENQLRIAKDGEVLTLACEQESGCDPISNVFQVQVTSWGEFALFVPVDIDQDGVADNFEGVIDNCPLVVNPLQGDFDGDGVGNACDLDDLTIVAKCQDVKLVADAATCLGSTSALAFDGGSIDYDGDALTFKVTPEAPYALGSTAVTLTVDDVASNLDDPADRCTAHVEVVDAAPPEIICPDDITAKSVSIDGVSVDDPQLISFFAGVSASDICDGDLNTANNAPNVFPLHSTSVEFMATDAAGNQSSCLATVTIRLLGDLNNDDKVTHDDIVIFYSELFRTDCSTRLPCLADLNEDGKVDGNDWEILYYQVINPVLR